MIRVSNRHCIRRLSLKSMWASRTRNIIAVAAIALTTLLFTALFTIGMCLNSTFQQETFRQIGSDMHGSFKAVTAEQADELSTDSLIVQSGRRLMLGYPTAAPFNKAFVEVSYMDEIYAKGAFCTPEHGTLPAEGTDEIACDTRILSLLGIIPEVGAEVTLTYLLGESTANPISITDTFTLSGWWEYDPAGMASMALVPRSYAEQVLQGYSSTQRSDSTGKWTLAVYLKSTAHISSDLRTILARHGYQCDDSSAENFIDIGVSWAYVSSALQAQADPALLFGLVAIMAVIVLTGYLIIYNVFQISVSNDIRFYGLLKTIGTTGQQLRRIVRLQALTLAIPGIAIGLVLGYGIGFAFVPITIATTSLSNAAYSASPVIFVGAAVFSLLTVLFSCSKPGRAAARVSPVEAVRYTEGADIQSRNITRHAKRKVTPFTMAAANIGRSRKKTVLVIISLSLAALLIQVTYTLAVGFDIDKYLKNWVVSDFVLSDAGYFRSRSDGSFDEAAIEAVQSTGLTTEGGSVYSANARCFEPEELYRNFYGKFLSEQEMDHVLKDVERDSDGNVKSNCDIYAMEPFALRHLGLLDGSFDTLSDPAQNTIAAVYQTGDYGLAIDTSHYVRVGDTVTLRYVDEWETYDDRTGEIVEPGEFKEADEEYYHVREKRWHEVEYTVVACATVPQAMSRRSYSGPQFVLNPEVLRRDAGDDMRLLNYLCNTSTENTEAMEQFLADYTTNVDAGLDYESKAKYINQFSQMRNMFLLLGGALSVVVAVIGVLNFLNAVLTSILSRRREFAVLQSIGMTGRQLVKMLVNEGLWYAALTAVLTLALSLVTGGLLENTVGKMLWFFTYRFTVRPLILVLPLFAILGSVIPAVVYHFVSRQTIVERLRETE